MISSIVSDTFVVSSTRIIKHILDHSDDTDFDVSSMLHGRMKNKTDTTVNYSRELDGAACRENACLP